MLQCLVGHDGAEVGAADADVDDVLDALAGVAEPAALAHVVGEDAHAIEYLVHVLDDVLTVDVQRGALGQAQGGVEDGAILRDVDVITAEHGGAAAGEVALLGELHEQLQRLRGDAVLRVVEEQPGAFGGEGLATGGITRKQLT